jgi:hypothetical protein
MLILATATNQPYFPRANPYFKSISEKSKADRNIVYLIDGFIPEERFPNIEYINIRSDLFLAPSQNFCIQHGEFFRQQECCNFNNEDLLIFTDADMRLNRWFDEEEIKLIDSIGQNEIALSGNASMVLSPENSTMLAEYYRIKPTISIRALQKIYGDISNITCYHTGVFVCRVETYRLISNIYIEMFPSFKDIFRHGAKEQWLLNYIINKNGIKVIDLPLAIHAHGCYGLPRRVVMKDMVAFTDGREIMFQHNIFT